MRKLDVEIKITDKYLNERKTKLKKVEQPIMLPTKIINNSQKQRI